MGTIRFNITSSGAAAESFTAIAGQNTVLSDSASPSSVTITSQPARGKVVARSDGKFSLNLDGDLATTDITFGYDRVVSGNTQSVSATISVSQNVRKQGGYAVPKAYLLETNSSDECIIEPGENTRIIYCDPDNGLSQTDIQTRHDGTGDGLDTALNLNFDELNDGTEARDNTGPPGAVISGTYYGETPGLAVDKEVTNFIISANQGVKSKSVQVFVKRGTTISGPLTSTYNFSNESESPLHPCAISYYDSGAKPIMQTSVAGTTETLKNSRYHEGLIVQGLDCRGVHFDWQSGNLFIIDGIDTQNSKANCSGGNNVINHGVTWRRIKSLDSIPYQPEGSSAEWGVDSQQNIYEMAYIANINGSLVEKCFTSGAGWDYQNGYRPDGNYTAGGAGKPPENYSHSVYMGVTNMNVQVYDCMFLSSSFSTMQLRAGATVCNVFGAGNNTGLAPIGNGPHDPESAGGRGSEQCNFSSVSRYTQTVGGFKDADYSSWSVVYAGGVNNYADESGFLNCMIANATEYAGQDTDTWSDPTIVTLGKLSPNRTNIGGGNMFFPYKNGSDTSFGAPANGTTKYDNTIFFGWSEGTYGTQNIGAVSQSTRDGLTIGAYEDAASSTTGSTLRSFDTRMRTLDIDTIIAELDDVIDFFQQPFGQDLGTRGAAQTVSFLPHSSTATPGQLARHRFDWDTNDLPGTVANDNIDLTGHRVYWQMTPANAISDFTFGAGGELIMWGGGLRPTGTVNVDSAGNTLTLNQGSKFELPAYSSSNVLTVDCRESRFCTRASVTGDVDITSIGRSEVIIYDSGALTVKDGRHLEVSGNGLVGFDGASGTPTLTVASGGTLSFQRGTRMIINGLTPYSNLSASGTLTEEYGHPQVGDIVEGAASGATAVVGAVRISSATEITLRLDNISGEFQASENLLGPTYAGEQYIGDSRNGTGSAGGDSDLAVLGAVSTIDSYVLPTIREVNTGENFNRATGARGTPSVTSTVVLASGSTVTVDTTGLATGTYDLIDVDSLTDNGATLPSGVAVSGNKLVLTVT